MKKEKYSAISKYEEGTKYNFIYHKKKTTEDWARTENSKYVLTNIIRAKLVRKKDTRNTNNKMERLYRKAVGECFYWNDLANRSKQGKIGLHLF